MYHESGSQETGGRKACRFAGTGELDQACGYAVPKDWQLQSSRLEVAARIWHGVLLR
jgi:hypothetical protein